MSTESTEAAYKILSDNADLLKQILEGDYSIYVVVRDDLAPGHQMAQVGHAVAGLVSQVYRFGDYDLQRYMRKAIDWGRMIVLASHGDCCELSSFVHARRDVFNLPNWERSFSFIEPDLDYEMTATAFLVNKNEEAFFSHLPLALKPKRKWWQRGN